MNKHVITILALITFLTSCAPDSKKDNGNSLNLKCTWQLITSTTVTNGKSVITDYTKGQKMIKIINDTHFAFLKHNTNKDSTLNFDAGGGAYTLNGNNYTEHLDFYNDRNWEGKSFKFKIFFKNDTLIQSGLERVEKEGIDRVIIEKYIKLKKP